MRLALVLLLATFGAALFADIIDDQFIRVDLDIDPLKGYIVPPSYAEAHRADLAANIPDTTKIDGFWMPSQTSAYVADRVFRERIHAGVKDPALLFPSLVPKAGRDGPDPSENLAHQQKELEAISVNFDHYARQYVGIIVKKQKLIFCNYSVGTKVDPSVDYIFTDKVFVGDGTVHFVQCHFDPETKTCTEVSMIGSWLPEEKR